MWQNPIFFHLKQWAPKASYILEYHMLQPACFIHLIWSCGCWSLFCVCQEDFFCLNKALNKDYRLLSLTYSITLWLCVQASQENVCLWIFEVAFFESFHALRAFGVEVIFKGKKTREDQLTWILVQIADFKWKIRNRIIRRFIVRFFTRVKQSGAHLT